MKPETDYAEGPSKFRLRFSLLALLIFVTLVCGLLAWLVQPKRVDATALFRVSSISPSLLNDDALLRDTRDFEILKDTQIAFVNSYFILNAAARKPGIAQLAIFRGQKISIEEWLEENLEVGFPDGGEVMEIKLCGPEKQADDLTLVVDAVAKAYLDEVVYKERSWRLSERDLLKRSLEDLNKKIEGKSQLVLDISKESGRMDGPNAAALRQLILDRLERVESELLRLENEQLKLKGDGTETDAKFYKTRIAQLHERQEVLEVQLAEKTEPSVELDAMRKEIEQLQQTADELAVKLHKLDIESKAPSRIEQLQPAVVSPAD